MDILVSALVVVFIISCWGLLALCRRLMEVQ